MRKARAWTAAVAVAAVALLAFAATAQALPTGFWGVVAQAAPSEEQLDRLQGGGVESIRVPFEWPTIQPEQGGAYDWSITDALVARASTAGVNVLASTGGAPQWAVPATGVPGTGGHLKAPSHLPVGGAGRAGWIAFLTAAIARYGPSGSFWAENPNVPRRPLRTWQIWNEENFKYFVARPNPAEYGKLVKISYTAVKSADPAARVILGGMFARPGEATRNYKPPRAYFASDFLEQMYQRTPGIKSKFNGVALHPYTPRYQELAPDIEEIRSVLARFHDAGKGIWITELGWSSKGKSPGNSFAKGVAGQATQLRGAFRLLKSNQRKWKIQGVYWFSVDDSPGTCNFCDGSGLFSFGFKPKKAWYEYVKFAGGTP
jgi:hypothetical protein